MANMVSGAFTNHLRLLPSTLQTVSQSQSRTHTHTNPKGERPKKRETISKKPQTQKNKLQKKNLLFNLSAQEEFSSPFLLNVG
jgi:hypothetical protein